MSKIVITVHGGTVTSVISDQPVDVVVLDYDLQLDDSATVINPQRVPGEDVVATYHASESDEYFLNEVFHQTMPSQSIEMKGEHHVHSH